MNLITPWVIVALTSFNGAAQTSATVARQRVDLIELNHFVDQQGREVFRQVLFYDWSAVHKRYIVRAWRLVRHESQLPQRRWKPDRFECSWCDDGVYREITATSFRETWSQQDPERQNRIHVAEENRRPLDKVR